MFKSLLLQSLNVISLDLVDIVLLIWFLFFVQLLNNLRKFLLTREPIPFVLLSFLMYSGFPSPYFVLSVNFLFLCLFSLSIPPTGRIKALFIPLLTLSIGIKVDIFYFYSVMSYP